MKQVGMTGFDEGIIEQYADHLYRKAAARVTWYAVGGALLGALAGAVASGLVHVTSHPIIPSRLGYATLLVGAAALAFYGYRLGEQRAFGLRLQAQLALHQLQVERTILHPVAAVAAAAVQHVEAPAPPAAAAPVVPAVAPPVAPPVPAPVEVAPRPPLTAPVAPPALAPIAQTASEPTPPAVTAPAHAVPPRLVEPAPPAVPPLTPPVSAGR